MFYILFYCYSHRFRRHCVSLPLGRHDLIAEQRGRDRGLHSLGKGYGTQYSPLPLHLSATVKFGIRKTPIKNEKLSPTKFFPILFLGQGYGGNDCNSVPSRRLSCEVDSTVHIG